MTHGKIGTIVILFAVTATMLPLTGCSDSSPKRRGPQNYREYRAANDPRFKADDNSGPVISSDDGDFGPASGEMAVLSADEIAAGKVANAGSVKGMIKYGGKAANRKMLNVTKTPYCVEWGQANHQIQTEDLVVSDSGGLANVVVYVSKGFNRFEFSPYSEARLVDQMGCRYVPHVLVAMTGQELAIRNSDKTSHNYHFTGRANDEINKTQAKPTTDTEILGEPELGASFACDIHPWMRSPTYIFKHPYYAVTAEDGSFEIKGLPAGTYEIAFEHERGDMSCASQTVTIEAGKAAAINAEFRR